MATVGRVTVYKNRLGLDRGKVRTISLLKSGHKATQHDSSTVGSELGGVNL
jgi:hypothetical protein